MARRCAAAASSVRSVVDDRPRQHLAVAARLFHAALGHPVNRRHLRAGVGRRNGDRGRPGFEGDPLAQPVVVPPPIVDAAVGATSWRAGGRRGPPRLGRASPPGKHLPTVSEPLRGVLRDNGSRSGSRLRGPASRRASDFVGRRSRLPTEDHTVGGLVRTKACMRLQSSSIQRQWRKVEAVGTGSTRSGSVSCPMRRLPTLVGQWERNARHGDTTGAGIPRTEWKAVTLLGPWVRAGGSRPVDHRAAAPVDVGDLGLTGGGQPDGALGSPVWGFFAIFSGRLSDSVGRRKSSSLRHLCSPCVRLFRNGRRLHQPAGRGAHGPDGGLVPPAASRPRPRPSRNGADSCRGSNRVALPCLGSAWARLSQRSCSPRALLALGLLGRRHPRDHRRPPAPLRSSRAGRHQGGS